MKRIRSAKSSTTRWPRWVSLLRESKHALRESSNIFESTMGRFLAEPLGHVILLTYLSRVSHLSKKPKAAAPAVSNPVM